MSNPFAIRKLGVPRVPSPLNLKEAGGHFVDDKEGVLYDIEVSDASAESASTTLRILEKAGPRELLFFAPRRV